MGKKGLGVRTEQQDRRDTHKIKTFEEFYRVSVLK